ncbi:MAG: PAS domain-containing protein [Chitinophagaceae bacterium]|nr:PAS domain-containing protein [Chitinophagaceae bacterium]
MHAIKAAGGITFAQDVSAAFQGMPKSAVVSGFIDFVLSPEAIANELKEFSQITISGSLPDDIIKSSSLKKIFILLNNKTGVDFSHYKPTTITRRIIRRMNLNKVNSLKDYISILQKKTDELNFLYQDLLINVTSFFRDPELFETLSKKIFPQLLKRRSLSEPIRIWIPACATGEEACSIAICLFEYLGDNALTTPIQIFATDLSEPAIQRARAGIYLKSTLQNISARRLAKFFVKIDSSYQIVKSIRDVCVYATHNLIKDPPFSKMDIISCQNVMIYLGPNAQRKVLQSFHYALKLTGHLLLGKSESIGSSTDLFVQVNKDLRIFTKTLAAPSLNLDYSVRQPFNSHGSLPDSDKLLTTQTSEADLIRETDKILLSQFVPASVVINKDLQILRFQGATANYLQPASGKASLNVLKMVKDELVFELRSLLHQAKKTDYIVRKEGVNLIINNLPGKVSIEIIPIKTASQNSHFLIVFQEKAIIPVPIEIIKGEKKFKDNRIRELEQQLKESKEQMKMMTEEFEATCEELQSANEEILSSNEELQSINEELETSKEELQSTNEELTTINEEVQHRNDDLKEAVNYAEAIVETIREPLIVLNADLHVRTANNAFYSIFKISQEETEGHYFYEIGNGQWDIAALKNELNDIISKNKSFENFELSNDFKTIGKKVLMFNAVRMAQEDKKKNRYMLAIEDVTERRLTEKKLAESFKLNSSILHSINDIFISVNDNWEFVYVNQQAAKFIGKKESQLLGKEIWNELSGYKDSILF